jgi:hypothetical protein
MMAESRPKHMTYKRFFLSWKGKPEIFRYLHFFAPQVLANGDLLCRGWNAIVQESYIYAFRCEFL